MVTPDGRRVGRHLGLMYYTIGQRQGLGIGGEGAPWYVADKRIADNELVVVQGHDHPALRANALAAADWSWTTGAPPAFGVALGGKTRYRQADAACRLEPSPEAGVGIVRFDQPQWAITPGQSVVLYEGDVCLGGGIIERTVADRVSGDQPVDQAA
jgi:tRNA-specific 2-thiouridylase